MLFACALAAVAALSAAPAGAEIIPVDLTLDPATPSVNTLNVDITVNVTGGGTIADGDTTTASGNMLADLHATFNLSTHVATVTGLEFTGGTMPFTDMSFLLDFSLFGSIAAVSQGMQATPDTPLPPGSVTGTTFAALEHDVIFNAGIVDITPSGMIATVLPPMSHDFSTSPLAVSNNALGTLTVSTPTIVFPNATYDVSLSIPVDFDEIMFQDPNGSVELSGTGTIQASGQFTRIIPEPASGLLLAFGAAALLRRRRR